MKEVILLWLSQSFWNSFNLSAVKDTTYAVTTSSQAYPWHASWLRSTTQPSWAQSEKIDMSCATQWQTQNKEIPWIALSSGMRHRKLCSWTTRQKNENQCVCFQLCTHGQMLKKPIGRNHSSFCFTTRTKSESIQSIKCWDYTALTVHPDYGMGRWESGQILCWTLLLSMRECYSCIFSTEKCLADPFYWSWSNNCLCHTCPVGTTAKKPIHHYTHQFLERFKNVENVMDQCAKMQLSSCVLLARSPHVCGISAAPNSKVTYVFCTNCDWFFYYSCN